MSFDPLIKEEEPVAEPAAPDPSEVLNQRFQELERQLSEKYQANKGIASPQVQYVPYPVPQGDGDGGDEELSEEEILKDIPGAVTRLAERLVSEREDALRQEVGQYLGNIYEENFERNMKDLAAHPYYKYVNDDLQKYFQDNPNEKFQKGRLKEKFDQLVGSQIDTIKNAEVEVVERVRAVDTAVPVSSSPVPARKDSPKKEIKLDADREEARQFYNQNFGLNMSAEEWVEIEEGRLLPRDGGSMPRSMHQDLSKGGE